MSEAGLLEALKKARADLLDGAWSEAEISDGPVKRLLAALGWDVFDPRSVKPEFNVGPGRVDFALKSAPAKVDVFLEIKAPGKADIQADQQLFQYTVHQGVPLACLTDGRVWSFYLPGGQGSYEDRRLFRLDLVERELEEACHRLDRYLGRGNVASGRFLQNAQEDYQDKARQQRVARALPDVWSRLLKCVELAGGWFVGAQTNVQEFEKRARVACAAAGLELGKDVIATFSKPDPQ